MPYMRIDRLTGTYAPTGTGSTNLAIITAAVPTGITAKGNNRRLIGFSCTVTKKGGGSGTISFGSTGGSAASIMATTDVACGSAGSLGKKFSATGADLNTGGNGRLFGAAASAAVQYLTATYTIGTDGATNPIVRWVALVMDEETFQDLTD